MPAAFYVLFGAAFTVAVSVSLGRVLIHRLGLPLYRTEAAAVAFLTGAALLSQWVFALAAAQLLHKGVFLASGALAIYFGWRHRVEEMPRFPALPRFWKWVLTLAALPFLVRYFVHAMAPEFSADGSAYHLAIVAKYYRERGFSWFTTNMYANISHAVDLLFVYAYAFGRHSSAALTHLSFLIVLVALMVSYARRFAFPVAGMVGAAFFFLAPVVAMDAASAYNDVATACILFGVFYLCQIWDQTRHRGLLVAIGILAGFAYGAKYTAFLAVPYALGFVAWRLWGNGNRRFLWRSLGTVAVLAGLWIAPWMIKNAIILSNPVSPFFNRWFPNPHVHVSFEEEYSRAMRNYPGIESWKVIPLEVTVRGGKLMGVFGPLFLLTPLGLLALRFPHGRRLLAAGILFGLTYFANIGTRFLIPAAPFLSLAMALGLSWQPRVLLLLALLHAASVWPAWLAKYADPHCWRLHRFSWRAALRIEAEADFLRYSLHAYHGARLIEELTPPGSTVFSFEQTAEAYTTRRYLVAYQSAFGQTLGGILLTPLIPEFQTRRRIEFRMTPRVVRAVRLRQVNSGSTDHMTITEVRVYSDGKEVPREPGWRLTARPNPWEVQDAFDNSPLTRWGSWQALEPGMYIEARFDRALRVDAVAAESSWDVGQMRLELDWLDEAGAWHTERSGNETGMTPPLGMRREATALLRSRGVTHLLVNADDFLAPDMLDKPEAWGISLVGEARGLRLYAIR